jgi:hypothetical protein
MDTLVELVEARKCPSIVPLRGVPAGSLVRVPCVDEEEAPVFMVLGPDPAVGVSMPFEGRVYLADLFSGLLGLWDGGTSVTYLFEGDQVRLTVDGS